MGFRIRVGVLGALLDVITWSCAIKNIVKWGAARESRLIFICNAHMAVTATLDKSFGQMMRVADMVTPDGWPVAKVIRRAGYPQDRVNGPDLMWKCLAEMEKSGQVVFFYGGAEETLFKLKAKMLTVFPDLIVGGMVSPPYRSLTAEEDQAYVDQINSAGTAVLFVGLGCPKQEYWMTARKGRIHAVMVGVGAAFDYHSGELKRAPLWMQNIGLEWLHRLASEPGRLWKRYLVTNTLFVLGMARSGFKAMVSEALQPGIPMESLPLSAAKQTDQSPQQKNR